MRSFIIKPGDLIPIGRAGENQATQIRFDVTGWAEAFGTGTYTLVVKRPHEDTSYPVEVTTDGDYVVWTVSNVDTGIAGNASVQLRYVVDGALAKSVIYTGIVGESLDNIVDPPDPFEDLIQRMVDLTERTEAAAESAAGSAASASESAGTATAAKTAAEAANTAAQSAKTAAQSANTDAQSAKTAAQSAKTAAEAAQSAAASSATAASGSAAAAAGSAAQAAASATAADASADAAQAVLDSIPADYSALSTEVAQLGVRSRNILPKQPTPGTTTVIDLGSERTFANGVNVSFDLFNFSGNSSGGIVRLRDASDSVVAMITLNGMRNTETWKAFSEETNPHTGRYTSYNITALRSSLTFRYVQIFLTSTFVTTGSIVNFSLTDGYNPTPFVPFLEAHDYDLESRTNPIEINTALNSISLMDATYWSAKADFFRNEHGGMTSSRGMLASRLFPCKSGDTLAYTLYMAYGTKALFTFDENMRIVRTIDAIDTTTPVTGTITFTATERFFAFNCVTSQIQRISLKYNDIPLTIRNYVAGYVSDYATGKERFPDYWDSAVESAVNTIKTKLMSLTTGDAFFFVTDQHWIGNAKYSSPIIDYICSECGLYNVFVGGDIVNNNNASKVGAMTEILDYLKSFQNPHIRLFSTLGNHDQNDVSQSDPSAVLSIPEQYNALIKPEEEWLDTDGTPLCNIYENKSQKIRYIQFFFSMSSGYRQDVADMLTAAMRGTPSGWTIVLMSHAYWNYDTTSQGAEAYATLITGLLDEIDADAPLWIVGHTHADKTAVLTSTGGKTCRIMSTTTDSVGQNPASPSMTAGTTTEQAFDVYLLDTTAKTINAVRVGAGESRSYSY